MENVINNQVEQLPTLSDTERATLVAHVDSQYCTRNALLNIDTPSATASWCPIPHHILVDTLLEDINKRGINVTREQYAVSENGAKLFATFDTDMRNSEYGSTIGLRTSNDKSMSLQIAIAKRVFVCDNLAFAGDLIALNRKHTSGIDLDYEIERGLDKWVDGTSTLSANIRKLKAIPMRVSDVEHMVFSVFDREILPARLFRPVVDSYRQVKHNGVVSQWALHNCLTLHAHKLPPQRKFRATTDIGKLFNL